ncbi:nuclear transport factor 2 family protein [Bauldia sp.]|uniref:nuclear transport factor 2 family protein n=1 Tax=Bauldia sp. TaxID=2575872 RepID=UPI003BA8C456
MTTKRSVRPIAAICTLLAGLFVAPFAAADDSDVDALAHDLVSQFYKALAPDNTELAGFLGDGFQIIGSDGVRFDRDGYLGFPKAITEFELSDVVARRDGNLVTATFQIGYKGTFVGVDREVPRLTRMAVFAETDDGWKLQALAALGTGANAIDDKATEVLTRWRAAVASGNADAIRPLTSPDFQLQTADGRGVDLGGFLKTPPSGEPEAVENIVATSFSNTLVVRYVLMASDGSRLPRLTVFQRINGEWRAAAEAAFAATS